MEASQSPNFLQPFSPGLDPSDLPSTMIQDIDLHLECDDDGNFCLPAVADSNNVLSHSVIGQNVNLSVTFPVPKQTEKAVSVFSCSQCDQTYSKHSKLAKHLLQVHEIEKNFQCTVCSFATTSTRLLRRHFVRKHVTKSGEKFRESRKCPSSSDQLESDKLCFTATTADSTGNTNLQSQSSENDEKSAFDTEHSNELESRAGLNVTKLKTSHDEEDSKEQRFDFMCSECAYRGITQKQLKMHFAIIHDPSREIYNCHVCEYSCKQKRTFIIHQRMHKNEKPFKCDFCQKSFFAMSTLKRHALIHATDRQHNCPFENCCQVFRYKDLLRSHISKVHKKCKGDNLTNDPEQQVSPSKSESNHKKKTLFACSWKGCEKSFRDNYNLKCHYCLHTGEKPLKCPRCEFKCVQQASLNCHVKKMHCEL
ncbi:zinc finger protein 354B-like [Haliotis cracherodii]|uniref:zinc finger protein 354B-like n=1 Tax=Haliotis cracherodii TaxID=6455 RepID=UPI0039EBE436